MLGGPLVTLSPLLLEDHLHLALGVLDNGRLDLDFVCWYDGVTAKRELTRADFVDLGKRKDVANFDILQTRNSEEVAWRKEIFATSYRGDNISCRLATDGRKGR